MDLVTELFRKQAELDLSIKHLADNGRAFAQAEKDYKMTVYEEVLKLKGTMAVTMINQIVYGIPNVAEKRFARDIAEVTYKANLEHINSVKLQIRVIQNQLDKEWGNAK